MLGVFLEVHATVFVRVWGTISDSRLTPGLAELHLKRRSQGFLARDMQDRKVRAGSGIAGDKAAQRLLRIAHDVETGLTLWETARRDLMLKWTFRKRDEESNDAVEIMFDDEAISY